MKHHSIKKRRPQNRTFFCPVCKNIFDLQHEVNLHVSQKHPTFKYRCRYCSKSYINYASKYKHQNSHGPCKHKCQVCRKRFQLKKKKSVHYRTHTGQGLYRCPRCPQFYTTKQAMDYHFKVHMDPKFDCNQCSLSTNTQAYLQQHIRGAHRSGWVSPCGIRYSWLPKMFHHHKKCSQ